MAKLLKLRRGTTSQHSSFTGAEGEVTVDTDKETLVVHNGAQAGGYPLARESDLAGKANLTGATFTGNVLIDNAQALRLGEADGSGTNFTGIKAQAQSADITLTLPAVAPTANQVLKADGSTPTTLTWAADASATDTNTTYSISCADGDNSDEEKIRLSAGGSGSGDDDIVLEAGTGLSVARSGDKITFTNTVSDTNTTYTAGAGLGLSSTTFSLDLDTTNEWTKPQTGNIVDNGTISNSNSTSDFDLDAGNNFKIDIDATVTLGFSNLDASREGQTGTIWVDNAAITPSWAEEVQFEGGTVLSLTQSAKSVVAYYVLPGGTDVLVTAILDVKDD